MHPGEDTRDSAAGFYPPTLWTQILNARSDGEVAEQAWRVLVGRYHGPIRSSIGKYVRDDPDNLTAEFLAYDFRGLVGKADPAKRFRKLLGAALHNFIHGELRKRYAIKRGEGVAAIPLDPASAERDSFLSTSPEAFYRALDARIALELFNRALARLRESFCKKHAGREFELLIGREAHVPIEAIAEEFGVNKGTIRKRRFDLRQRLQRLIREEAADLVTPQNVEEEIEYLGKLAGVEFREESKAE